MFTLLGETMQKQEKQMKQMKQIFSGAWALKFAGPA
jgi:hypothetical protein